MVEDKSIVRVKMRVGDVEFEIECGVDEIGGVVDRVLAAVGERHVPGISGGEKPGFVGRGETCKGLLFGLWQEGWFGVGRSLGEVHTELGRRGFHYDRTAVAHALVDLVREAVLTRIGRPRRYRYLQKRPPSVNKSKESD